MVYELVKQLLAQEVSEQQGIQIVSAFLVRLAQTVLEADDKRAGRVCVLPIAQRVRWVPTNMILNEAEINGGCD